MYGSLTLYIILALFSKLFLYIFIEFSEMCLAVTVNKINKLSMVDMINYLRYL